MANEIKYNLLKCHSGEETRCLVDVCNVAGFTLSRDTFQAI